jgi:Flp pilus assembly protein TadD
MLMVMTPRMRIVLGLLIISAIGGHTPAFSADADKDPALEKSLQEARTLIDGKKLPAAIKKCDEVIAAYKTSYEKRKEKVYCASTPAESLGYLVTAADEASHGVATKSGAITLSATWSNAYFLKAYALVDLGRTHEAKIAVQRAVDLSPLNSHYLNELGHLHQLEKEWAKAKAVFELAEGHVPLRPDEGKAEDLGRARRGLAYVLVELGRLEEAEKKYLQCLATDPKDTRAAQELEYVRGLRAKRDRNKI